MEQWEKNYYITAVAGSDVGRSLVVMSKGKWKFIFQMVYNYFSSVLLISQPYILNSLFFLLFTYFSNPKYRNSILAAVIQS